MKPKINKVGFEIEAEMSENCMNELVKNELGKITGDGSIRSCRSNCRSHSQEESLEAREFVSLPFEYTKEGMRKVTKTFRILSKYKSLKEFHWNVSMGFHIHVSFRPRLPVDCWNLEFAKFFYDKLSKDFPREFSRRKYNNYCFASYDDIDIAKGRNRYRAINFGPAFREHGTIEFRIFPSDNPKKLKSYLSFTLSNINYFLAHSFEYLKKDFPFEIESSEEERPEVIYEENVKEDKRELEIN